MFFHSNFEFLLVLHQHVRTKKGLVPLKGCPNSRSKAKCKHGFPKRVNVKCRVICEGNYRKFGLRISGRRNSFGCILGKRSKQYQSGTVRAFALAFGSNTHAQPNYRLPPHESTHDAECTADCLTRMQEEEKN